MHPLNNDVFKYNNFLYLIRNSIVGTGLETENDEVKYFFWNYLSDLYA